MRKALIVGIDHYAHVTPLSGCVNDAHAVKAVLERHADGTVKISSRPAYWPASTLVTSSRKTNSKRLYASYSPTMRT